MHTRERQREQLEMAGVAEFPSPDLAWLMHRPAVELAVPYVLLVPGAAPTRPRKRWPVGHYGALAALLAGGGMVPVVLRVDDLSDLPVADVVAAAAPLLRAAG
jgi:ADP-heptose:LPS heptosyltransferase